VSDWNHGNAHFLRGVATELAYCGHEVRIFEPKNSWSLRNLLADHGGAPIQDFERQYPQIRSIQYDLESIDLPTTVHDADIVLVHEWNDPNLVAALGKCRLHNPQQRLFFHDTHHRSVTDPDSIVMFDLQNYDGVLAFGNVIRDLYLSQGWARSAWTWHEAADVRVFRPIATSQKLGDLVWIGNWGDGERSDELREFLIEPVRRLRLSARVYGVRYPDHALKELQSAGIEYGGWLPNYRVPEVFSRFRVTVHIPRRPYSTALPGVPTIRPFEALACRIPLISAPWDDCEKLFREQDFLYASSGDEMTQQLESVLSNDALARSLSESGLATIRRRHTCSHRTNELLKLATELQSEPVAEEVVQ
jgi:spore maturation protein CgeB